MASSGGRSKPSKAHRPSWPTASSHRRFHPSSIDGGPTFALPRAEPGVLIRRLYFDLVGLPPTQEEIEDFIQQEAPDAYDRLVDRLLASPRYGERWARHWLDAAHFAETHGHDQDRIRENALALSRLSHYISQSRQAL